MSRLGLIGTLAAVLALAACGQQQRPKMPPPAVGFVVIKEQPVELTAELPGRTSPFAVSDVRPQINGIVKQRLFVEGSTVEAGQPLYQIDPAPYQAAFDSAEATRVSAKAKAARYRALFAQNAIAAQDNDDAQAAWKLAEANAQAARINLDYTRITAPITGRIGASSVTQGALVTANQTTALSTISTLDPIYVDIDQSTAELLALERQSKAGTVERGGPLTARVTLKLDDGSDYGREGQAAIHRRDGGPHHRLGPAAGDLPQSRRLCCCRAFMCARWSTRASIRMAFWRRNRASRATRRASPPRW